MKTILILLLTLFLFSCVPAKAQTCVKKDKNGNYVQCDTAAKSMSVPTDKFFIDAKGNRYPVYKSSKGKLFYKKISKKSGKTYNVYIKEE